MFLTAQELGLADFLAAIKFIPPAGKTVEYFISPSEVQGDTPGFVAEDLPTSDSITYTRKNPETKIAQSETPPEYAEVNALPVQNSGPKIPVVPQSTPTDALSCPFVDVLSDDNLGTDILLKENFGPFKRNTLFHCN